MVPPVFDPNQRPVKVYICLTCRRFGTATSFGPPLRAGRKVDDLCRACRTLGRRPHVRDDGPCRECGGPVARARRGDRRCPACDAARKRRLLSDRDAKQKAREYRQSRRQETRAYLQAWHAANPGRRDAIDRRRRDRETAQSDGTASFSSVLSMVDAAVDCPYCGADIKAGNTQVDHIVPVASGGVHGLVNLIVVCADCNQRKHSHPFSDWLLMIDEPYRTRCARMYRRRFGDLRQGLLI